MRALADPRRRPYLLLACLFALVLAANAGSLRLLQEDWCQLPYLRSGFLGNWTALRDVLSGRWQSRPRLEVTSYLAMGLVAVPAGLSPWPYFAFGFSLHLLSAVLEYRILRGLSGDEEFSLFAAALWLVFPTAPGALFFVKNWIFSLPVFFFLLQVHLHVFPPRRAAVEACALVAASLAGQFAGDQARPLFYFAFLCAAASAARRRRGLARVLVPAAICALALSAYGWLYVRPFATAEQLRLYAPVGAADFLGEFFDYFAACFVPWSWMFGGFTVVPSWATAAVAATMALLLASAFLLAPGPEAPAPRRPPVSVGQLAGMLAGGFACCLLPLLVAVRLGYRAEMEPRYLYAPGLFASGLACLLFSRAARGRLGARARARVCALAVGYCGFLTLYDLRDVWGEQKAVDERILRAIDRRLDPSVRFLVTDSLQRSALIPYSRSNAVSDFQSDWGVRCRLQAARGFTPAVVRRLRDLDPRGETVELEYYEGARCRARRDEILAVVFRYGPRFSDLRGGFLGVFPRLEEYLRFRRAEPIRFHD